MNKTVKELVGALGFFLLFGIFISVIIFLIFLFSGGSFTSNISSFTTEFMSLSDNMKEYQLSLPTFIDVFLPIIGIAVSTVLIFFGILKLVPPFEFLWHLIILVMTITGNTTYSSEDGKMSKKEYIKMQKFFNPKLGVGLIIFGIFLFWISRMNLN